MAWSKKEAILKLPPGVQAGATAVGTVTDALITILNILKSLTQTLASLSILDLNATQLVIKAAVTAVESALKDLVNDTGVYVLFVPAPRQTPLGDKVKQALADLGLTTLPGGGKLVGLTAPKQMDRNMEAFWAGLAGQGGNQAFVRTVLESLADEGDVNRPQLSPTDHVVGLYLVAGAPELTALTPVIRALNAIFGTLQPVETFDRPGLPQPRNLRPRIAASSSGPVTVLSWKQDTPITHVPSYNTWALVHQFAVLRSASAKFLGRKSTLEIFGTRDLTVGMKAKGVEVIAVEDVDPIAMNVVRSSYTDTPPKTGTPYYYAVTYSIKTGTYAQLISGGGYGLGFGKLSSVEKVFFEPRATASSRSTAPDWIRTPSALALVPDLQGFVDDALLFVDQLGGTLSGYPEMLKAYVRWLEAEIANYENFALKTVETVKILSNLLKQSFPVGLYTRSFSTAPADVGAQQGGNVFVTRDLVKAFSVDTNRPPFMRNEYVAGIVILAAAPSQAGVMAVQRALGLLFGSVDAQGNAIQNAVNQIGDVIESLEKQFGSDLRPVLTPATTNTPPRIGVADTVGGGGFTAPDGTAAPVGSAGTAGPWKFPPSLPAIGSSDKGNCPLLVKNLPTTPISFGPNLKPR